MVRPQTVEAIMAREVITCHPQDTLAHVRILMREADIRHVPVVDPHSGEFRGLITAKSVLRSSLKLVDRFGVNDLDHQLTKKRVEEVMERDVRAIDSGHDLQQAGQFFMGCRHGCLPVVDDGRLVGIVTSSDFVKLSLALLAQLDSPDGTRA